MDDFELEVDEIETENNDQFIDSTENEMPIDDHSLQPEEVPVHLPRSYGRVGNQDFMIISTLGKGGFGKVLLVKKKTGKDAGVNYAMKVVKKVSILRSEKDTTHQLAERSILEQVKHEFIVDMKYAYQTEGTLYLILEFAQGGELFSLLERQHTFDDSWASFYLAEIALALGHLHSVGVIYRDLKPENVLLSGKGHVKLADFGLCKQNIFHGDMSSTFCGTVEYMAPEVIKNRGHGKEVDWWSLGTLMYDMMNGNPPFQGETRDATIKQVVSGRLVFVQGAYLSKAAKHLILYLLKRDRGQRLGYGVEDYKAVIKHPFFNRIDFDKLIRLEITPPYVPDLRSDTDLSQFDERFTNMGYGQSVEVRPDPQHNTVFQGFSYVAPEVAETFARSFAPHSHLGQVAEEQPSNLQSITENLQQTTIASNSSSEHQETGIINTEMIPVPSARIPL